MEHRLKMGSHDVLYYTGQVCSTEYLAAYIPVTVSTNSSESTVSLNRTNFNEAARQMDGDYLDVKLFESEFVLQTGSNHLRPAVGNALATDKSLENKQFGGPTLVLASSNNYSVEGLMQMDPEELANQTAIMKSLGIAVSGLVLAHGALAQFYEPPPSTADPNTIRDCTWWYVAATGDGCASIASGHNLQLSNFFT